MHMGDFMASDYENRFYPLSDSVGHCPFLIPWSPFHTATPTSQHSPIPQLPFLLVLPVFLLPTFFLSFLSSLCLRRLEAKRMRRVRYQTAKSASWPRPQDGAPFWLIAPPRIDPRFATDRCVPSPLPPRSPWCSPEGPSWPLELALRFPMSHSDRPFLYVPVCETLLQVMVSKIIVLFHVTAGPFKCASLDWICFQWEIELESQPFPLKGD